MWLDSITTLPGNTGPFGIIFSTTNQARLVAIARRKASLMSPQPLKPGNCVCDVGSRAVTTKKGRMRVRRRFAKIAGQSKRSAMSTIWGIWALLAKRWCMSSNSSMYWILYSLAPMLIKSSNRVYLRDLYLPSSHLRKQPCRVRRKARISCLVFVLFPSLCDADVIIRKDGTRFVFPVTEGPSAIHRGFSNISGIGKIGYRFLTNILCSMP